MLDNFLNVCEEAVQAGGKIAQDNFNINHKVSSKNDTSLVTEIDILAEKIMRQVITKRFPGHKILGEELGGDLNSAKYTWIIDPIDGTSNYINKNPLYGCGAALVKDNQILCSALLIPELNHLYIAKKDQGSFLNGNPLSIKEEKALAKSIVATSRPKKFKEAFKEKISNISSEAQEVKILGTGLCSLAFVSSSKVDGAVCYIPKTWDVAPAILLAIEAGAIALNYSGQEWKLGDPEVVLASPKLAHSLASLIKTT